MNYKRVILKISGEALAGDKGYGFNFDMIEKVADELIEISDMGIEVGVVVGGGNIWRGRQGRDMDRATADYMGMLATVINSLALQDVIERKGKFSRVQTAIEMAKIAEPYIRRRAIKHMNKGRIVIFAAGTGNPYFSTDTAAALRAAEMEVDVLLLAKNVDGVYSQDPHLDETAVKYDSLTYMDVISKELHVMDTTAISLCMDNNIPIKVFGLNEKSGIKRAVNGETFGTIIHN